MCVCVLPLCTSVLVCTCVCACALHFRLQKEYGIETIDDLGRLSEKEFLELPVPYAIKHELDLMRKMTTGSDVVRVHVCMHAHVCMYAQNVCMCVKMCVCVKMCICVCEDVCVWTRCMHADIPASSSGDSGDAVYASRGWRRRGNLERADCE